MSKDMIIKESRNKVFLWIVLILIILAYLISMLYYSTVKKPAVIFSIVVAMILLFVEFKKFISPKIVIKADKEGIINTTTVDFKSIKWNEIKEIYIYKKTFLNINTIVTDNYLCFNLKKDKKRINVDFSKKYDNKGDTRILITGCKKNIQQIFNELELYYKTNIL
ncbi:hypothetical protein [Intestinibacter sp.]